jgi:hypothetical protein
MALIEGTTNILHGLHVEVRTHHNSRVLIHRLPDDILLKIFYFNSPSEAFDDNGSGYLEVPRTQLAYTHVCRRWRSLALGSPTLWAAPLLRWSVEAAETMLARAQKAPLKIFLAMRKTNMTLVNWVLQESGQIKHLRLHGGVRDLVTALTAHSHPAPLLETLRLTIYLEHPPAIIPPDIFNSHAPRLRIVELQNCTFGPMRCPLLANVTHLALRGDMGDGEKPLTLANLLITLTSAPNLERLEVEHVFDTSTFVLPPQTGRIALRHINLVDLNDDIACITLLLQLVSLPRTAQVLICQGVDTELLQIDTLDNMFRYLGSCEHLNGDARPIWMSMGGYSDSFTLRIRTLDTTEEQLSVHLQLDEDNIWEGAALEAGEIFINMTVYISFADLVTLTVYDLADWEDAQLLDSIRSVVRQMTKLRDLHVGFLAAGGFLVALGTLSHSSRDIAPLPRLSALHLSGCNLADKAELDEREGIPSLLQMLKVYLSARVTTFSLPALEVLHMWRGCKYENIEQPQELSEFIRLFLKTDVSRVEAEASLDPLV